MADTGAGGVSYENDGGGDIITYDVDEDYIGEVEEEQQQRQRQRQRQQLNSDHNIDYIGTAHNHRRSSSSVSTSTPTASVAMSRLLSSPPSSRTASPVSSRPTTPVTNKNRKKISRSATPPSPAVDYKNLFCQMISSSSHNEESSGSASKSEDNSNSNSRKALKPDRDSVLSELECTVCQEIISPPILQCKSGQHLICSPCLDGVKARAEQQSNNSNNNESEEEENQNNNNIPKCPTCRESMEEPYRNLALERMASNLLIKCRHINCNNVISYNDYKDHIDNCDYRPVRCQLCDDILESWQELWTHQKNKHSTKMASNSNTSKLLEQEGPFFVKELGCKGLKSVVEDRPAGWGKCFSSDIKSFDHESGFSLHINPFFIYMEDTKTLHFGVWEMGPQRQQVLNKKKQRQEILYDIIVCSCDNKIKVQHTSIKGISYRIDVDNIVKYGHEYECLRMTSKSIQRMSYNYTQKVIFQVKPVELVTVNEDGSYCYSGDNDEGVLDGNNNNNNSNIEDSLYSSSNNDFYFETLSS